MNWIKKFFGGVYAFPLMESPHLYSLHDRVYFDGGKYKVVSVGVDSWNSIDEYEWIIQRMWIQCAESQITIEIKNNNLRLKPIITVRA